MLEQFGTIVWLKVIQSCTAVCTLSTTEHNDNNNNNRVIKPSHHLHAETMLNFLLPVPNQKLNSRTAQQVTSEWKK